MKIRIFIKEKVEYRFTNKLSYSNWGGKLKRNYTAVLSIYTLSSSEFTFSRPI